LGYGIFEDEEHLLLVDLVVFVQICVFDELPHLHQVGCSLLPQEEQSIVEEIQDLEMLQSAVLVDVVLLKDFINGFAQLSLGNDCTHLDNKLK
jgi:hypothetical protein